MRINYTSPPFAAVGLSEARSHCRVSFGDDDTSLAAMAVAATLEFEAQAQVALLTRTVTVRLDGWPTSGAISLPVGPVMDGAEAIVTVDGAAFAAFELLPGKRPELRLTDTATAALELAEIVIAYPAGYGAEAAAIPADIKHAILDQVAALYDNRGAPSGREWAVSPALLRIAAKHRGVRV